MQNSTEYGDIVKRFLICKSPSPIKRRKVKYAVALGVIVTSIVLAVWGLLVVGAASAPAPARPVELTSDPPPVFTFDKYTGNPTVREGDTFTITLTVAPTELTSQMTQTLPFTVTDHNDWPGMVQFLAGSVTASEGNAYYNAVDLSVVWESEVLSTSMAQTVTFQVEVTNVSFTETKVFTNYARMELGYYPGTLPGPVPGLVAWDNFTVSPLVHGVSLSPGESALNTAGAIGLHTFTVRNTGDATQTFTFNHTGSLPGWGVEPIDPVALGPDESVAVDVTVIVAYAAPNFVTDRVTLTVTDGVASDSAVLETRTGGFWNAGLGRYVACRFDFNESGQIDILDAQSVGGRYLTEPPNPAYDRFRDLNYSVTGVYRIDILDAQTVGGRYLQFCPSP